MTYRSSKMLVLFSVPYTASRLSVAKSLNWHQFIMSMTNQFICLAHRIQPPIPKSTNSEFSQKNNCFWPKKYHYKETSPPFHYQIIELTIHHAYDKSIHLSCSTVPTTNSEINEFWIFTKKWIVFDQNKETSP